MLAAVGSEHYNYWWISMWDEFMFDDENDDDFYAQLNADLREIDEIWLKIDRLFSWHDFLMFQADNLLKLEKHFDDLRAQAKYVAEAAGLSRHFSFGILWVGAISAYEGAMHELFLQSLRVEELQGRIHAYCEQLAASGRRLPRGMEKVDAESIRTWLASTTISDPRAAARRFDQVYGIETVRPSKTWCDHILRIRNTFTHRNGIGVSVDDQDIVALTEKLEHLAISFHQAFADQGSRIASEP